VPWHAVPAGGMEWGEAWRLMQVIVLDPSSMTAASVAGWAHPAARLDQALADLYDLTHRIAAGKRSIKAYPRPWDRKTVRFGGTPLPQDKVREILRERGHGRLLHHQDARGRWRDERGRFVAG
jgi:hypothetical protein